MRKPRPDDDQPDFTFSSQRPTKEERRRSRRLRLNFETAVPVVVSHRGRVQWGLARNVSEGGMLVELSEPPPIASAIEIRLPGVRGSADAPEGVTLYGEVRHNVAWNVGGRPPSGLNAVGVRFVAAPPAELFSVPSSAIH